MVLVKLQVAEEQDATTPCSASFTLSIRRCIRKDMAWNVRTRTRSDVCLTLYRLTMVSPNPDALEFEVGRRGGEQVLIVLKVGFGRNGRVASEQPLMEHKGYQLVYYIHY